MSDESSQRTGTPSDTNSIQTQSPEPEPTTPLVNNEGNESLKTEVRENGVEEATVKKEGEGDEKSEANPPPPPPPVTEAVENLQTSAQQDSEDVVVTSVTVEVNRESPVAVCDGSECTIKNQNDAEGEKMEEKEGGDAPKSEEGESQEAKTEGETSEKNGKSTLAVEKVPTKGGDEEGEGVEVLISQQPRSNSFSVNVANVDTDEYSSSEDESTQPPPFVETESKGAANATPTQEVTSSEEPPIANGDCPTITVEKPEGQKKDEEEKEKRSGSESSSEGERLSPPAERRRSKLLFFLSTKRTLAINYVCVYLSDDLTPYETSR